MCAQGKATPRGEYLFSHGECHFVLEATEKAQREERWQEISPFPKNVALSPDL